MDVRGQLEERLRRDRDNILTWCQEMVRIPSENPPGNTVDIFTWVSSFLEKNGVDYETVAPEPTMPNLVASYEGGEPGKHLVLNGHMDVFPAGDPALWSADPFSGLVKDGKIFGRGVNDMKVGTLAAILTYVYLHQYKDALKGKLTLTAVSDEETFGPWGARWLVENRPDVLGDCVLNGEPGTPHSVRFGEKGLLWLELNVQTKGGHGGYPQASANAVKIAGQVIGELESLTEIQGDMPGEVAERIEAIRDDFDRQLGAGATDALHRVTVNIGTIHGGLKMNMIAADTRAEVDIRFPIGVSTDTGLRRFEEILKQYPEASYTVINRSEPNLVDPNHELVRIIQRNAEAARGIRPAPGIGLGGTDCRLWRLRGIPAFVYGPTPYNMGSPDEYALLDDLFGTVQVHVLTAYDYLTGATQ